MSASRALRLVLLAAALSAAPLAAAQEPASTPNCPADAEPLPAELAAWTARAPLAAAADAAHLSAAEIDVGHAVDAAMLATPDVAYPARPANPGGKVSHGGLFALVVEHAGVYRVAISTHSWIDVVVDGQPLDSIAHGRGPACSGIRKIVDYQLPAGRFVLQLSAGEAATTSLLVAERK